MSAEIGRICTKDRGREKGKKCIITDTIDKNYVLITGPESLTGIRRRRVNIRHLTLLKEKIPIERNASDKEINKVLKKEKKEDYMKAS